MRNLFVLFFLIALFTNQVVGQKYILNDIQLEENETAVEIIQNIDGAIWFITDKTLYSHDGHELSIQSTLNNDPERFTSIVVHNNKLFTGTNSGKLMLWTGDSLNTVENLNNDVINKMVPYGNKSLLLSSKNSGLYKYDMEDRQLVKLKSIDQSQINDIVVVNNEIFIATDIGLFHQPEMNEKERKIDNVGNAMITNISVQNSKYLWLSEFESKLYRLNIATHDIDTISILKNNRINDLNCSDSRLFVSSKKGLFHFNIENNDNPISNKNITQDSGHSITTALIDDEKNLWLGSKNFISKSSLLFAHWPIPINSEIQAIYYRENQLTLGTNDGVYNISYPSETIEKLLDNINVTCMDANTLELVVGTYDSGLIISNNNFRKHLLKNETILSLKYLSKNRLIVATLSGVHLFKKNGDDWVFDRKIQELSNYYILCIFVEDEKSIWFGTDKKGAIQYNDGNITKYHNDIDGNALKSIYSFTKTNDQIYASSKDLGLVQFQDNQFRVVPCPHGDWSTATSLCPIGESQILMVGIRDISIYDAGSQELLVFDKDLQIRVGESFLNNFSQLNEQVLFELNGRLFQSSIPEIRQRTHPLTSLKRVEVNLTKVDTSNHHYKESENNFSFTFNGILHRSPDKVNYSYMLEGFDEEWRYTGDRNISYPHIEPGVYTFKVKSIQNNNFTDADSIKYSFEIKRAFYNTLLFKLLVTTLCVLLILLWYRNDKKRKETDNELKIMKTETQLNNLKSQLNPHFLFNSFNTMIGLIEEDRNRSIEFVEHLTDFYRLVLEISEMELIPIAKEISMLNAYKHLLKERFPIGLVIDIDEEWGEFMIPPLSLQLLVENAVKHNVVSETQPLRISINLLDDKIVVKNNLNPRPIPPTSTGIGLSNLKKRYLILAKKNLKLIMTDTEVKVLLPIILPSDKSHII